MDWRSFDGTEGRVDFKRQAINHATARYLMLYLQEKGKLVRVYRAFRQQKIDDLEKDPMQEAVRLLATAMREPMTAVEQDFADWFLNLRRNETRMLPPNPDLPFSTETVNTPGISPPSGNAPTGNKSAGKEPAGNAPTGNTKFPNTSQQPINPGAPPGPPPGPPPSPPKKKP